MQRASHSYCIEREKRVKRVQPECALQMRGRGYDGLVDESLLVWRRAVWSLPFLLYHCEQPCRNPHRMKVGRDCHRGTDLQWLIGRIQDGAVDCEWFESVRIQVQRMKRPYIPLDLYLLLECRVAAGAEGVAWIQSWERMCCGNASQSRWPDSMCHFRWKNPMISCLYFHHYRFMKSLVSNKYSQNVSLLKLKRIDTLSIISSSSSDLNKLGFGISWILFWLTWTVSAHTWKIEGRRWVNERFKDGTWVHAFKQSNFDDCLFDRLKHSKTFYFELLAWNVWWFWRLEWNKEGVRRMIRNSRQLSCLWRHQIWECGWVERIDVWWFWEFLEQPCHP